LTPLPGAGGLVRLGVLQIIVEIEKGPRGWDNQRGPFDEELCAGEPAAPSSTQSESSAPAPAQPLYKPRLLENPMAAEQQWTKLCWRTDLKELSRLISVENGLRVRFALGKL